MMSCKPLRILCCALALGVAPASCQRVAKADDRAPAADVKTKNAGDAGDAGAKSKDAGAPPKGTDSNPIRTDATSQGVAAATSGKSGDEPGKAGGKEPHAGSAGRRDNGPSPVRVTPAVRRVSPRIVSIIAMLNGRRQADVYSKVTGRITTLGPAEGEPVKQGEILFRVDRSDPGETYLNTPVVSPLTGWIGRWSVTNVGAQIAPTDSVVTVVDDVSLRSVVNLPASDWLLVKRDTKVIADLGGQQRAATIRTIAVSADPASGRGSITIEIPNPNRDWRVGMFATVTLALEPKERMLIGATSLTMTDKGTYVYIVDGDIARRIAVKYAVMDSDTVEILDGLKDNAQVISAGGNLIGDGSPIKVLPDPPSEKAPSAKSEAAVKAATP